MPKVKLLCLNVSSKAKDFTIDRLYTEAWIIIKDGKAKSLVVLADNDKKKIGPCYFNASKELVSAGCKFRIILITGE